MDIDLTKISGLNHEEALERLRQFGRNELPSQKKRGFLALFISVIKEPMLGLLLGAGIIYLILGEPKDAIMLSTFILFMIGITVYQERKTENAIEALKDLSTPKVTVVRNGVRQIVSGKDIVPGDLVLVKSGDRLPADGKVVQTDNFQVDESVLTGESLPVGKSIWSEDIEIAKPGGDNLGMVYSGTLGVSGRAIVEVTKTGVNTEMGKIGKTLINIFDEETLLHKETKRIVRIFVILGLAFCFGVIVLWALVKGNWLEGILYGLTISMSMLPEEFPVVLTIFFALGAWRLSKKQVLARHMAVVETLGAATYLCVDKTGTITKNLLQLTHINLDNVVIRTDEDNLNQEGIKDIILTARLASEKDPLGMLENTIREYCRKVWNKDRMEDFVNNKIKEYPLDQKNMMTSYAYKSDGDNYLIASKGAPEIILGKSDLTYEETVKIKKVIEEMTGDGLRLIAVGKTVWQGDLPENQSEFKLKFMGILGFSDPPRDDVDEAVMEAVGAGIRVVMLTGDYPGTAKSIAAQIGLDNDNLITGEELDNMNDEELDKRILDISIFARILPDQKFKIVEALKRRGEIVAMTGDGVNDAPALKSANIGIAMGKRGTDVAREASDLILVDDDFLSIVEAVKMGRRIYDNLRKAIAFIFAVHIPIAGLSLLPLLLGLPVILFPAHIAFLELIIDPACSTVFEAEEAEKDIMKRPPRKLNERLFSKRLVLLGLLQGGVVLALVFIVYLLAIAGGRSETEIRTMSFLALVTGNLSLIISNLSWKRGVIAELIQSTRALKLIIACVGFGMFIILSIEPLRSLFHFSVLKSGDYIIAFTAGLISISWFELFKIYNRKMSIIKT